MGLLGLGKGIGTLLIGIVEGDAEMIAKGAKKTAVNAVTTTAQIVAREVWDKAHTDDDED